MLWSANVMTTGEAVSKNPMKQESKKSNLQDYLEQFRGGRISLAVLSIDMFNSLVCSLVAVLLVRWFSEPFGNFSNFLLVWLLMSLFASLAGFFVVRTFSISILHSTVRSIGKLTSATLIKEGILLICLLVELILGNNVHMKVMVLLLDLPVTMCSLICFRVLVVGLYHSMRDNPQNNVFKMTSLICGTTFKSSSIVTRLSDSTHYNVIGFLTKSEKSNGMIFCDKRVYAVRNVKEFSELKTRLGVECLIFPPHTAKDAELAIFRQYCAAENVHMMLVPDIDEVKLTVDEMTIAARARATYASPSVLAAAQTKGKASEEYIPDGMSPFEVSVKRFVDFCLSAVLLFIFSPLFLICYIAIKKEDGGPAIYAQERIGRFGRPFRIYKFRSMRVDAESLGPALAAGERDPRLTKVGAFLRAHHLDELPQLMNVFLGDMAFVGPRPERKFYIDQIMEVDRRYRFLYQIRPGVTSYATFYNGYADSLEKMLRRLDYDIYYLRNRSWWFDIKILAQTFLNIVFGEKF